MRVSDENVKLGGIKPIFPFGAAYLQADVLYEMAFDSAISDTAFWM